MSGLWILLVGGVLPAIFWGVTAVFQKASAASTGPSFFLIGFGLATATVGAVSALLWRGTGFTAAGLGFAVAAGTTFALGTGLISVALFAWAAPLARLAPIWSCNVLVTLAISLFLLREADGVDAIKALAGTALILGGAWLVTQA